MLTTLGHMWKLPFISTWFVGEKALDQQETALGVFLDVEGALNNTSYESMCTALFKHTVLYTTVRWITATLKDNLAATTFGLFSKRVAVSMCCPQEGVISPILWVLVLDELTARLNWGGIYSQGYADDICLVVVGIFPNILQWTLHTVMRWCD